MLLVLFIFAMYVVASHHEVHQHDWHQEQEHRQKKISVCCEWSKIGIDEVVIEFDFTQCHDKHIHQRCPKCTKDTLELYS